MTRWWPLAIPFALGLVCVFFPLQQVQAAGEDMGFRGPALFTMGLFGIASLGLLPWVFAWALQIQRRDQCSAAEFALAVVVATLPTAWIQCLNPDGTVMPILWMWWPWDATISMQQNALWDSVAYAVVFLVISTGWYVIAHMPTTDDWPD